MCPTKEIGLFEAKTNLSKIAENVKRTGQPVTLTRRGEPYVDLVPHQDTPIRRRSQAQVLTELDKLRLALRESAGHRSGIVVAGEESVISQ